MMARLNPANKVKTFSIGFDDKDFDELKYARIVARQFNTEHHEFVVKPNALQILPELVERYGEPYADSSCIPTYYVARETRQYVTVALNGDGGDELFSGYERYRAFYLSNLYNRLPCFFRKGLIELPINSLPSDPEGRTYLNRLKRFLRGTGLPSPNRYLHWIAFFDEKLQQNLYTKSFLACVPELNPVKLLMPYFTGSNRHEMLDDILCLDTNTYLPNDLLVKVDIATMANSLEARSPFLDHRLAEFVASLKVDFKMRHFIKKFLLKHVIKDFIPKENINRPKMGFGLPVGKWFKAELKGLLTDTLLSSKSLNRGYFNPEFIKSLIAQHLEAKANYTQQLWCLLMLELWHRRFID
jgi:asparagine synthase (glutamine-hydrolysing)